MPCTAHITHTLVWALFYKIIPITIEKEKLDIDNLPKNSLLQIIPNKKENKFEKNKYTYFK